MYFLAPMVGLGAEHSLMLVSPFPTAAPSSLPFLYQLTQLFRRIQKATLCRLYPLALRD